ncbi:amino acid ABC transporter substrate-binding protein [Kytococcus sedentarius]|uniref:Periplasmic component of amino acid ABC-type transporter/signal transduction system n=1 Tax=Kytococcus sedentarius (strain ATCC 14392 / DSM 20547 / JCM 11482 / CCUG 33030 / NBRC 15357 / NCTC 11040 / CCM 314 / 541) TaxID=478801 RepID=C7NH06_KYTSD|nr:ABC transporter substrate-binding protein [Kytococcus sedentarius]ACV06176.1 periplasmic component of amino acid ABC-type transporter/signal transduction system [Kytococcus sedentarius DSM 20547]QQB64527.1 amino acid ABC transporter substrate-binding protein [Kytococcus sedentarius]STX12403.1 Glutamine-binding periplasmic protein precursor [Kytococcus sedentarius]
MSHTSPHLRLLAVAAAAALTLAACGSEEDDSTGGGGDDASADLSLISDGKLTVCSDIPYAPFEFEDPDADSGYSGFDIDITSEIAKGLDLELAVKDADFSGLQSGLALNSGQCDLVASAMTITDDRKKNLGFSDGYYDSLQSLLVPEGSDITGIGDLNGKKVGVQQATSGEKYAQENAEGAQLVALPSNAEMVQAIKAGQVDALLQDLPVNVDNAKAGGYEVVEEFDTGETYGLAAKKDNQALLDAVNAELSEMRDNGTYDEFYDKYFTVEGEGEGEESPAASESSSSAS